jgi:hypothetical protein
MPKCYISVIYKGNVIFSIPLPCWNHQMILEQFSSLNSEIKYHINNDNDIVITDMTYSQKEPSTKESYITVLTLFGQLFIPLLVASKDEDNIKESMRSLLYFNEYSNKINENTLSIDNFIEYL